MMQATGCIGVSWLYWSDETVCSICIYTVSQNVAYLIFYNLKKLEPMIVIFGMQ